MLSFVIIGLIATIVAEKTVQVDQDITLDEWANEFPLAGLTGSEYEIVPIYTGRLEKRDINNEKHVRIRAFNKDIKLLLNPSDGILAGEKTPVYEIFNGPRIVEYPGLMKMAAARLYQNAPHAATMMINKVSDNKISLTGHIGSHDMYVRPLPNHLSRQVRRYRRSLDKIPESEIENYHYHAVYKVDDLPEHLKHLQQPFTTSIRSKRSTSGTLYPEILVIVDYPLYKLFQNNVWEAIFYLLPFWNAVDMKFRSLKNPNVRLNIAGIILARDPYALQYMHDHKFSADELKVYKALDNSRTWLFKLEPQIPLDKYDVAVTMTSDHFCIPIDSECNRGTIGLAYIGGACNIDRDHNQTTRSALVHDNSGYSGVPVAAHELGHLFGGRHDGTHNLQCAHSDGNIMASNFVFTGKISGWSPCSQTEFHRFFSKSEAKCLENKPNTGRQVARFLPGKLMDAHQQCKLQFGTHAGNYDENICKILFCLSPDSDKNDEVYVGSTKAADGTRCADGKICINSECVNE